MREKKDSHIKYTIRVIFAAVLLDILINAISIWNYATVDEKREADVCIVLGAGTSAGKVSPVFEERLRHGIWLYQNGYVRKLILTGGYGAGNSYSDSYTAKLYVKAQGVPEADILIEEKSSITQENIYYAKEIMEQINAETAILVSDPLHMKRAMLMAKDFGLEVFSSPTPTSRYVGIKSEFKFLRREIFFYMGYKIYRLL